MSCFLRRKSRAIRGGNYAAKGLTRLAFEIEERSQEPLSALCRSCDPMCANMSLTGVERLPGRSLHQESSTSGRSGCPQVIQLIS